MPLQFDSAWYYVNYIFQVSMDLRRQGCDIVHLHNFSQFAPIVRALNPARSIVLHMHCEWLTQIRRETIRRRLGSVDRIIGCSHFVTDRIRERFPERAESCRAVHNGVDVSRFHGARNPTAAGSGHEPRILFVGRVSPEKGVHVLLAAFRRVLERLPGARLKLIGPLGASEKEFIVTPSDDPKVVALGPLFDGDYVSLLKNDLPSEVAARVEFAGELPYFDVEKEYRTADVCVCPSVWEEPFGLPAAEAMACGVPVVASRSGGLSEVVADNVTGLLVERGDAEGLSNALISLLSDAPRREQMGQEAAERVRRLFTWEKVAGDLAELYGGMRRKTR
jgi:glycosyltransferase involved in cell wall biosynthesis